MSYASTILESFGRDTVITAPELEEIHQIGLDRIRKILRRLRMQGELQIVARTSSKKYGENIYALADKKAKPSTPGVIIHRLVTATRHSQSAQTGFVHCSQRRPGGAFC